MAQIFNTTCIAYLHLRTRARLRERIRRSEVQKLAYSIEEATQAAPVGRTKLYAAIADGSLKARKNGKRTLILAGDFQRWLESLPELGEAAA